MAEKELTPFNLSVRSGIIMVLFTIAFTAMMAATYQVTRVQINASTEENKMRLINEVLDPSSYDNDLLRDALALPAVPELGKAAGSVVWRARKAGQPVGLVMEVVAPNGYAGRIDMVMGVLADGTISGVRIVTHKETPGLGDYIDPARDKNKASPWITQFTKRSPATTPLERLKVQKDGGDIVYRTGATISTRAVTDAVAKAARYATENRDQLYR